MNVLMIAPEPFFEPRGTPISVYQRLWALSELGYQVDLLTYHVGRDVNIPNVSVHRTPRIPFIRAVKIGPSFTKLFLDILLFFQAITLLLRRQYDVIHTHEEASFFSLVLRPLFRINHLYDMHSSLPRQLKSFNFGNWWPLYQLFTRLERRVLHTCDAVITIDDELRTYVKAINSTVPALSIENHAVHISRRSEQAAPLQPLHKKELFQNRVPIVYTGTFERYQGLDLLLASLKTVASQVPAVLYILVGGRPYQVKQLQAAVRAEQLDEWIHFAGMVSPEEALTYLDIAEVLVSPRINGTSIPLKIYSYLHAGKAIVATDLPAHTQVLNDQIALLVMPTAAALADGIVKLLRAPDLRRSLAQRAQQFAQEQYNATDYLAKVAQVYQTLRPAAEVAEKSIRRLETR